MVVVYDSLFLKIPIMQRSFQGEVDMEFPQNLGKFVSSIRQTLKLILSTSYHRWRCNVNNEKYIPILFVFVWHLM